MYIYIRIYTAIYLYWPEVLFISSLLLINYLSTSVFSIS